LQIFVLHFLKISLALKIQFSDELTSHVTSLPKDDLMAGYKPDKVRASLRRKRRRTCPKGLKHNFHCPRRKEVHQVWLCTAQGAFRCNPVIVK
jgi:hypothetical protein